jgi:hypothetical protein
MLNLKIKNIMEKENYLIKGKLVYLGVVGVDSGQLMVCDPCYIDGQWQDEGFKDVRTYRDTKTGVEYQYPIHFTNYDQTLLHAHMKLIGLAKDDKKKVEKAKKTTKRVAKLKDKTINQLLADGELEHVKNEPTGKFSYDGCCKATLSGEGGGQLNYRMGHAGAGVAFSTRWGDGVYPVYAQLDEDGRFKRIIIDFSNEEDDEDFIE